MITHIKDTNTDSCIIFIHGLGGGVETFHKFSVYLNRKWDLYFGILCNYFSYYKYLIASTLWSKIPGNLLLPFKAFWSQRNTHNVKLLDEYIINHCSHSRNIILVAHSMGGLIARQHLIECRKNQVDISRYKMICTYATPHNGSYVADVISFLNIIPIIKYLYKFISKNFNYRISPQIGDLCGFSDFIKNLNKDWRDYDMDRNIKFLRMVASNDLLVKTGSAKYHNENGENVFYFYNSHSSIIKPQPNITSFPPIDQLIKRLKLLEFEEEYFEELDEEITYEDDLQDDF